MLDATPEEFLSDIKRIRTWLDSLEKNIKKAISEDKYNEENINDAYMYMLQGRDDIEDASSSLESAVKEEEIVDTSNISTLSELPIKNVEEKAYALANYGHYYEVLEPKPDEVLETLRYAQQEWQKRNALTKKGSAQAEADSKIPRTLEEIRSIPWSAPAPRPKPIFVVIPKDILETQPENSKEILDLVGYLLNKEYDWDSVLLLLGKPTV